MAPEKMRFRYKLEGRDADWQDPENRRRAFYSDLPPGNYQFHVIAANNDGVWNEQGATADFTILPAFFQTAWFRALSIFAGIAILWLLYTLRVRRLATSIQARFDDRLEERERCATCMTHFYRESSALPSILILRTTTCMLIPRRSPRCNAASSLLAQVSKEGRNTILSLTHRRGVPERSGKGALAARRRICPARERRLSGGY